jgi:hypothetical protein
VQDPGEEEQGDDADAQSGSANPEIADVSQKRVGPVGRAHFRVAGPVDIGERHIKDCDEQKDDPNG